MGEDKNKTYIYLKLIKHTFTRNLYNIIYVCIGARKLTSAAKHVCHSQKNQRSRSIHLISTGAVLDLPFPG